MLSVGTGKLGGGWEKINGNSGRFQQILDRKKHSYKENQRVLLRFMGHVSERTFEIHVIYPFR